MENERHAICLGKGLTGPAGVTAGIGWKYNTTAQYHRVVNQPLKLSRFCTRAYALYQWLVRGRHRIPVGRRPSNTTFMKWTSFWSPAYSTYRRTGETHTPLVSIGFGTRERRAHPHLKNSIQLGLGLVRRQIVEVFNLIRPLDGIPRRSWVHTERSISARKL